MRIHSGDDDLLPNESSRATIKIESTVADASQKHIGRYTCEYEGCNRTYSTVGNLRTHMKTHKGKIFIIKCPHSVGSFLHYYEI